VVIAEDKCPCPKQQYRVENARNEDCEGRLKLSCGATSGDVADVLHIVALFGKYMIGAGPKSTKLSRSIRHRDFIGPVSASREKVKSPGV
jgi:hypothetical protein